jgi:hypothetical protein
VRGSERKREEDRGREREEERGEEREEEIEEEREEEREDKRERKTVQQSVFLIFNGRKLLDEFLPYLALDCNKEFF